MQFLLTHFAESQPYLQLAAIPQALGWIWIFAVVVGMTLRPTWAPSPARMLAPIAIALSWTLAPLVFGIVHARSELLANVLATGAPANARAATLAHDVSAQIDLVLLIAGTLNGFGLLLLVPGSAIAVVAARRARRPLAPTLLLLTALVLPTVAVSMALALFGAQLAHAFAAIGGLDPDARMQALASAFAVAHERIVLGRLALLVAGVGAAALAATAAVQAAKGGVVVPRLTLWATGLACLGGLVAVAGTRGHAGDAAHLMPVAATYESVNAINGADKTPRIDDHCQPIAVQEPLVYVERGHVTIDGTPEASLIDSFRVLRSSFGLSHPDEQWRGAFYLLAAPGEPLAPIAEALAGVHRDGQWKHVLAVVRRAHAQPTHTLGVLQRDVLCTRSLTLADDGRKLAGFATWGELVAATADGSLAVAP